jgi:hypothetical protein
MSIRAWEIAVALVALVYALSEFSVGGLGVALGILAGTAAWLATRAQPREGNGEAAGYARRKSRLLLFRVVALILALLATLGTMVAALLAHWQHDVRGNVAVVSLTAVALLLMSEIEPSVDVATDWLIGARAEEAVGAELDPLSEIGWLVTHDWKKSRGGNVDHIVCGPGGAFAIETKSSRFRWGSLSQAAGNAAEIKKTLGVRWVQGVLCVDDPEQAPTKRDPVWVVSRQGLRDWLLAQHDKPVDTQAAAAALDVYLP